MKDFLGWFVFDVFVDAVCSIYDNFPASVNPPLPLPPSPPALLEYLREKEGGERRGRGEKEG